MTMISFHSRYRFHVGYHEPSFADEKLLEEYRTGHPNQLREGEVLLGGGGPGVKL